MTDTPDNVLASEANQFQGSILTTARGSSILAAGSLFEFGGRFVIGFLLARLLGAEQYGLVNLALVAATVTAGIASLGLDSALVRYVAILASKRDELGLWGALQVGIGIALCVSVLMGVGLFTLAHPISQHLFHEPNLVPLLQLLGLTVPFLTLSNVLVSVAYGFKRMEYSAIAENLVQLLVRLFLIGVFALVGLNAFQVAIAFGLSDVAASAVLVYLLNKRFPWKRPLRAARRDTREIVSFALGLWLASLLKKFRRNIQTILLGALSTVTDVGVFALVGNVDLVGRFILSSIYVAVKPLYAELYAREDWQEMGYVYQTTGRWAFMLNIPMFLCLVLFPEAILSIFGETFVNGAAALTILAWAALVNVSTGTCGIIIDMAGYVKLKLVNSVLSIALTLGANLLLIPLWGVLGAAVARLIGLATIEFLRVVEVWFLFRLLPYNLSFVKPVVAGLAALVVALAINPWFPAEANLLYLAIQVFTVFAMYAGTLLALGLAPEDRAVLIRMYQRASSMFSQNRAVLVSFLSARSG